MKKVLKKWDWSDDQSHIACNGLQLLTTATTNYVWVNNPFISSLFRVVKTLHQDKIPTLFPVIITAQKYT